jgi:phosphoglycerate dehydrogenase-like enzyme
LVRLIAPFKMNVIAFSPHADPADASRLGVTLVNTIQQVFRESDFVSLHNRLTDKNHGMIDKTLLELMKPTACFVNVARGELVDEESLIRILREQRIAGAALDVFDTEPLPLVSPLLELDNVILTPHWLCSTKQSGRATMAGVMEQMLRVASGEAPQKNVLNPAVLGRPGFLAKLARWK